MIEHKLVMAEADKVTATAGVKVKGNKKYLMVKDRVEIFRKHYGLNLGIDTTVLHIDDKVVRVQAKIIDANNKVIGSGLAEEVRSSSHITKTSALEVCESSAIGRCLASLALHGGEYASAEEMISAVAKQEKIAVVEEAVEKHAVEKQEAVKEVQKHFPDSEEVDKEYKTPRDTHSMDFEPEYNWQAWWEIQVSSINTFTTKADVKKYLDQRGTDLKKFEEQNPDNYKNLKTLINNKYKECE